MKNVHPFECESSRLFLFRFFFQPLKISVLPGPCLRSYSLPIRLPFLTSSSSHFMLASSTYIYMGQVSSGFEIHVSMWISYKHCKLVCVQDRSQIFPLPTPPALASQPEKWSCILLISFSHLSPSPSPCPCPCPHCLFLYSSENLVTTLPKSSLPPFKLHTAARKILQRRSDQVTALKCAVTGDVCRFSCWVMSNSFATPWTVCSPPSSSVHVISQARILEWDALPSSRGSSRSRDWTRISCVVRRILHHWATWEARGYSLLTLLILAAVSFLGGISKSPSQLVRFPY